MCILDIDVVDSEDGAATLLGDDGMEKMILRFQLEAAQQSIIYMERELAEQRKANADLQRTLKHKVTHFFPHFLNYLFLFLLSFYKYFYKFFLEKIRSRRK
jgi:hypothetical protein